MVDDGSHRCSASFPHQLAGADPAEPALSASGTLAKGEAWPTTNRDLNFRLTVRDGRAVSPATT